MSIAFTGSLMLSPNVALTPKVQTLDGAGDVLGTVSFGDWSGPDFFIGARTPEQLDRLAEAVQAAAQMMRNHAGQDTAAA